MSRHCLPFPQKQPAARHRIQTRAVQPPAAPGLPSQSPAIRTHGTLMPHRHSAVRSLCIPSYPGRHLIPCLGFTIRNLKFALCNLPFSISHQTQRASASLLAIQVLQTSPRSGFRQKAAICKAGQRPPVAHMGSNEQNNNWLGHQSPCNQLPLWEIRNLFPVDLAG